MSTARTGKPLTVLGHLAELRGVLLKSVIALVITTIISFVFADRLFAILLRPAGGVKLIYTEMTEMIGTWMKVCLFGGIVLAAPFIIFQIILFVSPALTRQEKKYVYLVMPWVCLMFIGGVLFGYFVLLPPAVNILTTWGSEIATPFITIGNYISVITRLLLAIGLVFEMPVISTFLARIGVLKGQWLASKRKFAIVAAFALGGIITPTFDPINQSLVALPLIVLYEASIWLARVVQPREGPKMAPAASATANR